MPEYSLWLYATVLGPVILAGVIAYALITRRKLTPGERKAQIAGTERAYREDAKSENE